MNNQKRIICRLCFKIQDDLHNFKAIEDLKDVLDKVLQNLDLTTIQYPVMCTNCADTLTKCFEFKAKCINTHQYISSFIDKDAVKLDLIDVYKSKNENVSGVADVLGVCGLCMSPMENYSAPPVDVEGDVALRKMIEQCLPELDMNIIKKPLICLPCRGSLENYSSFLSGCLIVEEIIKNYCENQNMDGNNGATDLSRLLHSAIRDIAGNVIGCSSGFIKVENQFCEEMGNADETGINNEGGVLKFEQVFCDDHKNTKEEFELKSEHFMDKDELKFKIEEHITPKDMACEYVVKIEEPFCGENEIEEPFRGKNGLKRENLVKVEDQKCVLNEEVDIKTDESDFNRIENGHFPQPKNSKGDFKIHSLMYTDPSGVTMYKCDSCLYQAKRKDHIKRHLLKHKDPSEVTMYKCNSCSYQTKNNENLKRHLLKHKDPSEVTMYKCDFCWYQAKDKEYLRRHLLKHKDPSEVTMYKCASCSYQAKNKEYLKRHFLKHKDSTEVVIYKCDSCFFETKHKRNLDNHFLKHMDPSDVTMYKCDLCSFVSKYKKSLDRHLLNHKVSSDVTIYECDSCSFQTNRKCCLDMHLMAHKDPLKVPMYKCYSCIYRKKSKSHTSSNIS